MRSNVSVKINHYATQTTFPGHKTTYQTHYKKRKVSSLIFTSNPVVTKKQSMHNHLCIDNRLMHDIINHRRYRV